MNKKYVYLILYSLIILALASSAFASVKTYSNGQVKVISQDETFVVYATDKVIDTNSSEFEDIAEVDLAVGYGADKIGAINDARNNLTNLGYNSFDENIGFKLLNPATGLSVSYISDLRAEDSSKNMAHIIYDSDTLTNEQKNTLAEREVAGMYEPKIVVIEQDDSPNNINDLISN